MAGQIAVWEIGAGTCLGIIEHPTSHNVSAMAWNPKGEIFIHLKYIVFYILTSIFSRVNRLLH